MENQKVTKLQVNDSWGKKFTSSAHLVELFHNKVIDRVSLGKTEGFHWWTETFNYFTHDGRLIAQITHNSDFGPCTQAYGVELKVTSLKSDFKINVANKVWSKDFFIVQGTHAMRRLAKGKTIKEYYYN